MPEKVPDPFSVTLPSLLCHGYATSCGTIGLGVRLAGWFERLYAKVVANGGDDLTRRREELQPH